jgi:hypothetical protein
VYFSDERRKIFHRNKEIPLQPKKRTVGIHHLIAATLCAVLFSGCITLTGAAQTATAQQRSSEHVPSDGQLFTGRSGGELAQMVPTADPKDVASPEALVRALHDSVSGPVGDWDERRLLSLCLPHMVFAYPEAGAHGVIRISVVSLDDMARQVKKVHKSSPWLERTFVTHVTRGGNIAVAYYNGEARKGPTGKLIERGISICEMIYDGKRWWIASDIWDDIGSRPWPADLDPERQR